MAFSNLHLNFIIEHISLHTWISGFSFLNVNNDDFWIFFYSCNKPFCNILHSVSHTGGTQYMINKLKCMKPIRRLFWLFSKTENYGWVPRKIFSILISQIPSIVICLYNRISLQSLRFLVKPQLFWSMLHLW